MTSRPDLTLDFFHDVVCCWCFNISSRMRRLACEFDLDIRHRTFVLQASPAEMRTRWGSPDEARQTILGHWDTCRSVSDQPELIDVDAMREADFDYPHGYTAALACKAAEILGGQELHWNLFDRIQRAHLSEARNVADPAELAQLAQDVGLDPEQFSLAMTDPAIARDVAADRKYARALQVGAIPALVVRETGTRLVNGTLQDLRAQIRAAIHLNPD
ncbi:DsbA family oxidoreductase [Celeribacter arenosi]|uniref:DsbA family protein n=1 Tax=Celeribacter arenosi TaxID=792649 RepID=A0ABP7JWU9_9RHOB